MGLRHSQSQDISRHHFSNEIQSSLEEVLQPFRHESALSVRDHPPRSKRDILKEEEETSQRKVSHDRSRSVNDDHSKNKRKHISRSSSSIKCQWQCHLCQTLNQTDSQLCSDCGSTIINLYIPILNQNHKTNITNEQQHPSSTLESNSIQFVDENVNHTIDNENNLQEENLSHRSVLIKHKRKEDENILLKHLQEVLHRLSLSDTIFEDQAFPSSFKSLYINGHSLSKPTLDIITDQQTNISSCNDIIWLRPEQIKPPHWNDNDKYQWTVYRNPKPNDVFQGALGDCWFITALSVLAEQPEYLMKVLITKEYNHQGIYYVRLCKDGEWTQVIVDDRFPCTSNKRLAYSQSHRKQLWVPLIEKALAKLNGSYESIIAGRCCEGLSTVTGSPCESLILGKSNNPDDKNIDHEHFWMKLFHAHSQRFLMCAMCSNNIIHKQDFENAGLLYNHAYSLQDLKQSNDGLHRLIKLRNPWGGTFRWKGDWSDHSHLWTLYPDLRRELFKEKGNKRDGVFWMPFSSFVKYFECVDICKIRADWYEVRDGGNFSPEVGMMQGFYLTISTVTELDITLYRKISTNLRIERSEVSLCVAIVNIQEKSNGNDRISSIPILSQRAQHKFVSTNGYLQPGIYLILPFLFNPINKHMDNTRFNIAVHSSRAIDLQRIQIPLRIKREFLIKLSLFYGEKILRRNKNSNEVDDGIEIYELKKYWDGLILLVENRNLNKYIHFHFRCTLSQNAFISRKDSNQQFFDVIPPMHRQIIVTIYRKNAAHSFTIGHDYQYHLSSQQFIKNSHLNKQKHFPQIDESTFSEDIHLPQSISYTKQH